MKRFLEWTASQTLINQQQSTGSFNSNPSQSQQRRNSHHGQSPTTVTANVSAAAATTTTTTNSIAMQPQSSLQNSARELEIQHLSKLLHEIKYYQASSSPLPSAASSQSQREFVDKVHKTLPLFLRVFGNQNMLNNLNAAAASSSLLLSATSRDSCCFQSTQSINYLEYYSEPIIRASDAATASSLLSSPASSTKPNSPNPLSQASSTIQLQQQNTQPAQVPQMDRFPDLLPFAFTIARLFVSEVRQRASNKHAEDASLAILHFLKPKPRESFNSSSTQPASPIPTVSTLAAAGPDDDQFATRSSSRLSTNLTPAQDQSALETAQGWNLLLSLNTLVLSQSSQIIQLLCDASLPSTLIKCLYLFFDLPATQSSEKPDKLHQVSGDNNSQPPTSTIIPSYGPLIKAFTQLLVQLCSNQAAIDELIKKDDFRLLIGIASSQCAKHNKVWRRTAFQTLLTISKNMRDNFMYIELNLCIQVYVENMHRINSLNLITIDEYIDMIKTLLEFIYNLDVLNRNQTRLIAPIIEQFKTSRLSDLIEELILKIDESIVHELEQLNVNSPMPEQSASNEMATCLSNAANTVLIDEYRKYGRKLLQSLTLMAKINISQDSMLNIVNLKPLTTSRFEMFEQFKMPKPTAKHCILNYDVLRIFKMVWSKCQDNYMIDSILDATISLFNDDKFNYFIFETQQILVYYMTSYNYQKFSFKIKQKLLKFLEFIIIETNYIPCLELGTLGTMISSKKEASSSPNRNSNLDLILGLRTLIACLRFNAKFSDIFRDIGLLEVIIELLIHTMQRGKFSTNIEISGRSQESNSNLEVLYLLMEASQYLLAGPNNLNCVQFNESGAARHVFNCLTKPEFFHLFIPAQGSSSDDGGQQSRTNTPPLSANQLNRQRQAEYNQGDYIQQLYNKPSIKQLQKVAFTIIRQLILSSAGDEHLANLLGLLARNLDDLKKLEATSALVSDKDASDEQAGPETSSKSRINLAFLISQEVNLKICILKSLMIILKDSHRCRALFRKAGGFIYIVSSIVTLEKSLPMCQGEVADTTSVEQTRWRRVNSRRIWRLIKNSLMTIVVAIRFEPSNLRAFSDEVLDKFTEAIRNLGCFNSQVKAFSETDPKFDQSSYDSNYNIYKSIFLAPSTRDLSTISNDNIKPNEACCQLFRFLFDMSIDLGDATTELEIYLEQQHKKSLSKLTSYSYQGHTDLKSMSFDQGSSVLMNSSRESGIFRKRSQLNMAPKRPPSLDLESKIGKDKAILTYPCVIISIIDLIPSCSSLDLILFVSQVVKSLFVHERNLQSLCEAGLISKLLSVNWQLTLLDKNHYLYDISEYMFEKLTKQVITPRELRTFLRLNDPLNCKNLDDIEVTESSEETKMKLINSNNVELSNNNSPSPFKISKTEKVSTDRIEALVMMMSDGMQNQHHSQYNNQIQPPYVEFDMSNDGFSTIFMPSIAPVNVKSLPVNASSFLNCTLDVHTNEKNGILGGVGSIERQFPPMAGLTFSSWFHIDRFPSRSSDASHNIRLLTIYRGSAATGKEYSCFRIQISALDRALTISTQEMLLFENESNSSNSAAGNKDNLQHDPDCNVRIWTPELLLEGKWHHLGVTMNRSPVKQSRIHVYVDGKLVHHQRICYLNSFVGTTNSGPLGGGINSNSSNIATSAAAYVNAFIGSLPQYRFRLRTQWKQGPCHLVEEPLSSNFISVIYALGPNFIGNFQNSQKLTEIAKNIAPQQQNHQIVQQYSSVEQSSGHKPLVQQQSAAVVSQHQASHQLTRVSSSNVSSLNSSQSQHGGSSAISSQSFSLNEDRVLLSLDARAASFMTLPRMRRIYTRFDCRQVGRVLGLAMNESSTPILLLHNTGVHLNGPSRGVGAITIGYNHVRCFVPSPTQQTLISLGGCYILLGLIAQAETNASFEMSLVALVNALKYNSILEAQMEHINGYQILSVFYWMKKHLLDSKILGLTFSLITDTGNSTNARVHNDSSSCPVKTIQQVGALRDLICECFDLWLQTDMINLVLEFIYDLISSTPTPAAPNTNLAQTELNTLNVFNSRRTRNLRHLRDMDLLPRMLRLLPQYDPLQMDSSLASTSSSPDVKDLNNVTFDTKAVYLIKQTVFELLNRTPRQTDILYFGQFLASLLPSKNKERPLKTISLRNILLKSLLQMMTKNKQAEVNNAMQEELVRILGFDWFMLFISGAYLDNETITLGFLNFLIVLSNDDLYNNFKQPPSKSPLLLNGGWLKEPVFPTMDSKFNIQLLGINVGVFFGLSGRKKSIKQEVLNAPNFFLLTNCLKNLIESPRVYLMIFQTMMSRFEKLDTSTIDTISGFDKLNLDLLCDCLVGDTHHKRRQTLASIQFKCHELVVCLVYMLADIIWHPDSPQLSICDDPKKSSSSSSSQQQTFHGYPVDVIRFLMYLYNNNHEFQFYCRRSDDLIDALCETLMQPITECSSDQRIMTHHPASKEILELSRLIILDTMTDTSQSNDPNSNYDHLHALERFLDSSSGCREAQGELIHMLLRQILLMIDSTARHNSIKTIGSSNNILQFQLLLTNSIIVSQIVTDKIWLKELYCDKLSNVLLIIDHQLCLAEQIFKFNELLPKNNPPHAFIMQRVLNRMILFALSRPLKHISDKMILLDLLKKIYDNRTIIILNHMHSPQSAEFFVCFAYCLMKIIEENSMSTYQSEDGPSSLIERQYGHPSFSSISDSSGPSSSALMLVSMAKKVWDAIYQSKKGILSEAFDVSLSLPAFTLDTSLDLIQLKPDINDTCEKYWSSFLEFEQRTPKRRILTTQKQSNDLSGSNSSGANTATSAAVNILSGRLTKVVNAASFVSRVVGATAGSMASNVNLVGEKLTQTARVSSSNVSVGGNRRESHLRTNSDASSVLVNSSNQLTSTQSVPVTGDPAKDQSDTFKYPAITRDQIQEAAQTHISIIDYYIEGQLSQKNQKLALHKYLCDEWLDIEYEILLRERAIFGPDYGSKLDKWCLDLTEGPRRMRKKMVNNTRQFYDNYPYRPEQYNPSNKSLRYRPPMSYDSYLYYMKTLSLDNHLLKIGDGSNQTTVEKVFENCSIDGAVVDESIKSSPGPIQKPSPTVDDANNVEQTMTLPSINAGPSSPSKSPAQDHYSSVESLNANNQSSELPTGTQRLTPSENFNDDGDSTSFVDFSPEIEAETNSARESAENIDSLSVLRLLEKNERISHMFRCSRVQGFDTYEGLLLFGREHFYLIDGFTLLKTREIKDIDSLPPDAHDPIIPNSTPNILAHSKKTCSKFAFDSVIEVHKRRYLLQPIALEVFSSDGRNTLIVFPRSIRNKVYSRLMTVSTKLNSNASESLAGQKSNVSVEGGSGILSNLIGDTSVTQRWVRGELSNFQYLMNLNTIAGRSYNDLMQYPIFPWILADYSSDQLDFSKPSTFRDLSRPIGAQTSDRLEQFKRRYADWDDTETPPYHYGTFYSSAMIVASYMVRMEPFTQHFLCLQGGHFDLADRMFHSIQDSWLSASKHNMADIKELIPEFFYLPEFLKNSNKFDLGIKQNGMKLNDVILPPWAKGDTREFIRLHRAALESDYVSSHLHEWIDLIFGYKQQGQAAIDSVNVFHHLFYEGNVDIYNTDIDPIKKNAVIGFINNFGQVPKQLFKKPHPMRKVTSVSTPISSSPATSIISSSTSALNPSAILPSLSASSGSSSLQKVLTHCPSSLKSTNITYKDLRGPVGQIIQIDQKTTNIVAVEQNKLLIPPEYCRYVAWGHPDRSLRFGLYDSEKPIFVWEGSDILSPMEILCCTIPNNRMMITAGTESILTVWKIDKMKSFHPVLNLYGHVEPITCLASSQSYSLIVSGSRDRTAIIWDLNRFTFVRQLGAKSDESSVQHNGPISAIAINDSTGDIATCASSWLYLWTINGELLAHIDSMGVIIQQSLAAGINSSISANLGQVHILSVCFSQYNEWDSDEVLITGASDGSVAIWSMRYFQCPMKPEEIEAERKSKEIVVFTSTNDEQQSNSEQINVDDKNMDDEGEEVEEENNQSITAGSEPIVIRRRQRTDTMNSDWVKLSTSSNSTIETIPVQNATPNSITSENTSELMAVAAAPIPSPEKSIQSSTEISKENNEEDGFFPQDHQASNKLVESPVCRTPTYSVNVVENVRDSSSMVGDSRTNSVNILNAETCKAKLSAPIDPSLIKFSKSDTSLVDSFVILGDTNNSLTKQQQSKSQLNERTRPQSSVGTQRSPITKCNKKRIVGGHYQNFRLKSTACSKLLPNHRWKRELYLRAILPRRSTIKNSPVAAVTSITISKDHKTLFVGDSTGRITNYSTA